MGKPTASTPDTLSFRFGGVDQRPRNLGQLELDMWVVKDNENLLKEELGVSDFPVYGYDFLTRFLGLYKEVKGSGRTQSFMIPDQPYELSLRKSSQDSILLAIKEKADSAVPFIQISVTTETLDASLLGGLESFRKAIGDAPNHHSPVQEQWRQLADLAEEALHRRPRESGHPSNEGGK
jgi:hypothetical protein